MEQSTTYVGLQFPGTSYSFVLDGISLCALSWAARAAGGQAAAEGLLQTPDELLAAQRAPGVLVKPQRRGRVRCRLAGQMLPPRAQPRGCASAIGAGAVMVMVRSRRGAPVRTAPGSPAANSRG